MIATRAIGAPLDRIDGIAKVTGAAKYAAEHNLDRATHAFAVQSTIAKGRIIAIDPARALALEGVLAVLTHENAPRLASTDDAELVVLQSDAVNYHGQIVAVVVAETPEIARQAAALVDVGYEQEAHEVRLDSASPDLYKPDHVNPRFETDTLSGDPDAALRSAPVSIDVTYTTPTYHNNPLEPHATVAVWNDDGITLYDANQGPHTIRNDVAMAFGLEPERVRVIAPHVGGGFGSKAFTHAHVIAAVMAAQHVRRPVKLPLTRQQMFSLVGYRTPTIQRIQIGAERDGRLIAITHDVVEQTSRVEEFAEQTAVATRLMYAAPNRRTTHRLARLDLPTPTIMRAPGETPGMFAQESAIDEIAIACDVDPVELRVLNEPERDPETGMPFSSRNLVACLREGARRFGWTGRNRTPGSRRDGRWLIGTGVAASTYPARRRGATARIRASGRDDVYNVLIDAIDIGTGTWTALTQIAADALDVPVEQIRLEIGDSALPRAPGAGGSMGLASWGTAIVEAANRFRAVLREHAGAVPADGLEVEASSGDNPNANQFSMHGFGAQFAEVRVDAETGEVHVPRLVGVFAVGRIVNAKTGRSQLLGGMTMGISMALHEESVLDEQFGMYANHDFAEYHIATNADVGTIDVSWIDEEDRYINPMGAKGIGEIGITGTAAAIGNAAYDATGVRVRDLPIRLDAFLK